MKSRQPKLSATGSELERYYRLEPEQVDGPVFWWWIDHSNASPRLSIFALDVLAIPAMSTDYKRAFGLAKLTVSSQRHSQLGSSIESIQLLKNSIRGGCVTLGGLYLSNKAVRSHGQNHKAWNSSTGPIVYQISINQSIRSDAEGKVSVQFRFTP